ncbi:hypothetical protein BASA61_008828 [Batrachochytrium salamandrivorans]|nr:hypothetical protein BASA62_010434 [Batrachochytrium salamandrivorans]KAH6581940.1 hypothetical protein BASA61_008828 [Batrachochytrium salamandrivorans]KAH9270235.1 hypothetical protein BASA83_007572 [Batrachochytrium salamandrivorans]KAJ1336455.1 hypothetical protein BSLG_007239 [Batrachochytrium salamandrivorans]
MSHAHSTGLVANADPQEHSKDSESDDDLILSSSSMAALQEFIREKNEAEAKFIALKEVAQKEADAAALLAKEIDIFDFKEDWQLSQFWYANSTRDALAIESIKNTVDGGRIGCISSPSVFVTLKRMNPEHRDLVVFEFDRRFDVYGDGFVFYDYSEPLALDEKDGLRPLKGTFDYLLIDPPFLSEECWRKMAQTVRWLAKPDCKIIVCTGKQMRSLIEEELQCYATDYMPEHQNGLQNEFRAFINYPSEKFMRTE